MTGGARGHRGRRGFRSDARRIKVPEVRDSGGAHVRLHEGETARYDLAARAVTIAGDPARMRDADGNSLRGLVKYLDQVSDEAIPKVEIPTGKPLVYELDAGLKPLRHYYLGEDGAKKATR